MTDEFIRARIQEQEKYIIELVLRRKSGELTFPRYQELHDSAVAIKDNFEKQLSYGGSY